MALNLNDRQKKALSTLEWLLDPSEHPRQTGRTTALVVAAIRAAIRNPGRWVTLVDHTGDKRMSNYMVPCAHDIAFRIGLKGIAVKRSFPSLRMDPSIQVSKEALEQLFTAEEITELLYSRDYAKDVVPGLSKSIWDHLSE